MHERAFPTTAEADLIERLRAAQDTVVSLVAILDEQVIGHAMFSMLTAPFRALARDPSRLSRNTGEGASPRG